MVLQIRKLGILAKILAKEKITVTVSNHQQTASFELKRRILTLPNWDMSEVLGDMFTTHEVSHAKNTPAYEYMDAIDKQSKEDKSLYASTLNIVEDARIEKLIMREYPGTKKWFYKGYKELMDRDFFKLQDKVYEDRKILDRLNIFFKAKIAYDFDNHVFSEKEEYFIEKMSNLEKFDEVLEVTNELFQYCKETENYEKDKGENGEGGEGQEGGFRFILSDEPPDENAKPIKLGEKDEVKDGELILSPDSLNRLNEFLKESISKTDISELFLDEYNPKDFINEFEYINSYTTYGEEFYSKEKKLINFCISEFERKKRARDLSRIRESNTGVIDVNKLVNYKYDDNIFKQLEMIAEHKNHGFVFLIDLSSSMKNCINQVFKQLLILVSFCKKTNIPFEVYGFTSVYNGKSIKVDQLTPAGVIKFMDNKSKLHSIIKLFNNLVEYNDKMGSTPLSSTLVGMRNIIESFKARNNVDKLNFILLSDGGCDNGYLNNDGVVVDKKTCIRLEADYNYANKSKSYIAPIMNIIRDRTDAKITVYYLVNSIYENMVEYDFTQKDLQTFEDKGYALVKNKFGADQIFYVNQSIIFSNNENNNPYFLMKQFIGEIS